MPFLRKITPTVAGITVMMIGVSLVRVGAIDPQGVRGQGRWNIWGPLNLVHWHALIILAIVCVNRGKEPAVAHELAHR